MWRWSIEGDLKESVLWGVVSGRLWQSGVLCGNVDGTRDKRFFSDAVPVNEPGGKKGLDDLEHPVIFAPFVWLLPVFHRVFLFDRKALFYRYDSLDGPKPGMPVTGLFCQQGFAWSVW